MSIAVRKQIVVPQEIPHTADEASADEALDRTILVHMIQADESAFCQSGPSEKVIDDRSTWLSWFAKYITTAQPAGISVVVGFAEPFQPQAISMLSAMRDLSGVPVIVSTAGNFSLADEQRTQLRALGFTGHDGMNQDAYAFNIANYKETPEWLNPRNWANPELWDKFRW